MIFSFTGKKGSGKTTAAKVLEELGFVRINFKDSLIESMREKFPLLLKELCIIYSTDVDGLFKNKPPALTFLMQEYATNVVRGIDKDYWVKAWIKKIKNNRNDIVVDDVRFKNEAKAVFNNIGILVRIKRRGLEIDEHVSETEMDSLCCEKVIENNGSKKDLEDKIKNLYKEMVGYSY